MKTKSRGSCKTSAAFLFAEPLAVLTVLIVLLILLILLLAVFLILVILIVLAVLLILIVLIAVHAFTSQLDCKDSLPPVRKAMHGIFFTGGRLLCF